MADARASVSSVSKLIENDCTQPLEAFLAVEKERNKIKFKWKGSLESLIDFAKNILNLAGDWRFTTNNGGFHVLKSDSVTLSFYPGTKTLNVQGAKQDRIRKQLLTLTATASDNQTQNTTIELDDHISSLSEEEEFQNESFTSDNVLSQGRTSSAQALTISTSTALPAISQSTKDTICSSCAQNTILISDLRQRITVIEDRVLRSPRPSYEELQSKIKALEQERDSLLTALRLMREDITDCSMREDKTNHSEPDEWQTVEKQQNNKMKKAKPIQANRDRSKPAGTSSVRSKKKSEAFILGDSMTKFIRGDKMPEGYKTKCYTFPGATADDMIDFAKPIARRKPKKIVLHVGTNNTRADTPDQIANKISTIAENIGKVSPGTSIAISGIIHREDDRSLNVKIDKVNFLLSKSCSQNSWGYIDNRDIKKDCLNRGGLHLNRKGIFSLESSFKIFISDDSYIDNN